MLRLWVLIAFFFTQFSAAGEVYFQEGALIRDIAKLDVEKPQCSLSELDFQFPGSKAWKIATALPESSTGNSNTKSLHLTTFWTENDIEIHCSSPFKQIDFQDLKRLVGKHLPIHAGQAPTIVTQRPLEEAASLLNQFNRTPALDRQARTHEKTTKIIDLDLATQPTPSRDSNRAL